MSNTAELARQSMNGQSENNEVAMLKMKRKEIGDLLEARKKDFNDVLPSHLPAKKLVRIALTSISSNPLLLKCTQNTLLGSIIKASQLGLEFDLLGQCYLVPYYNKKKRRYEAQLQIGYRGLVELARRSGKVRSIVANEVRANDHFAYEYGLNEDLKHIPAEGERGEVIYFYAYCKMNDGAFQFTVMNKQAVDTIRNRAQTDKVWSDHYVEMGKKTVIKRLAKLLPLTSESREAVALDNRSEGGEVQVLDTDVERLDDDGGFLGEIEDEAGQIEDKRNQIEQARTVPKTESSPPQAQQEKEQGQATSSPDASFKKLLSSLTKCKTLKALNEWRAQNEISISWLPEDLKNSIESEAGAYEKHLTEKKK